MAVVLVHFDTFREAYFSPTVTAMIPPIDNKPNPPPSLEGYPTPLIKSSDNIVTGYYLPTNDTHPTTAVLYLQSFDATFSSPEIFQETVQEFLALCRQDGITRIIIDLQVNPGGYLYLGFDVFRQFFPHIPVESFNRWRTHPSFTAVAEVFSAASESMDPHTTSSSDAIRLFNTFFNYRYDVNATNDPFETFSQKFAPHEHNNDNFTAIAQFNLDDPFTANQTFGLGIDITGHGARTNFSQPFPPENIVLLTDGFCASTCAHLHTLFTRLAGVQSVVIGGRPSPAPAPAVGGVTGMQVLSYAQIRNYALVALQQEHSTPSQRAELEKLTRLPMRLSTQSYVNVRDQMSGGDGVPVQFVSEDAACRIFKTEEMVFEPWAVWGAVEGVRWGAGECVAGGGFVGVDGLGARGVGVGAGRRGETRVGKRETRVIGGERDGGWREEFMNERVRVV